MLIVIMKIIIITSDQDLDHVKMSSGLISSLWIVMKKIGLIKLQPRTPIAYNTLILFTIQ